MTTKTRYYVIDGGHPLKGKVTVSGAKNAITKQLVASLLTDEICEFTNVPDIQDVNVVLDMLSEVGTEFTSLSPRAELQTRFIKNSTISQKHSGSNRIPILMLGPLLHRVGEVTVPMIGGCQIGVRKIDFHLEGLRKMGVKVEVTADHFTAKATELHGAHIQFPYPSVGATENLVMTATLAKGRTVLENAAVEPEIIDTILFLQKMGALITIDANRRIIIEGLGGKQKLLRGAKHSAIADRIEVASFAAAAVATNGEITVEGANLEHMISFVNHLRKIGGDFRVAGDRITFFRREKELSPVNIQTDVHPGFMTDWQQPFAVMLTQANGPSVIHETVMSNRFGYTKALKQLGANIHLHIDCLGNRKCRFANKNHLHSCIIVGRTALKGAAEQEDVEKITIPDLRAGFAYIIAALVAEGTSMIEGIEYVERGYAAIPERLKAIGAKIELREVEPAPKLAAVPA
jgi:UDP-N-acetylglucosamine 1-carboxyvinyltransferase